MSHKKAYFHLRDETSKYTGYSRIELHALAKQRILPHLIDEDDCWIIPVTNNNDELSTKNLSERGWELFFEEFRNFIHNIS